MNEDALRCSTADRHRAQALLSEALGRGQIELHEFDERVQQCMSATTRGELLALFEDLFVDPRQALFPTSSTRAGGYGGYGAVPDWNRDGLLGEHHGFAEIAAAESMGRAMWQLEKNRTTWDKVKDAFASEEQKERRKRGLTEVIFSSSHRVNWTIGKEHKVELAFGSATVDLRSARFSSMVTDIKVSALGGNVKILVPQGIRVETTQEDFATIFSQHVERGAVDPRRLSPSAPLVRIHSDSAFARVQVVITAS